MRPLPRLHAITDARVLALQDLGVRAAAIAAAGSAAALHVRDHGATGRRLTEITQRFVALAGPPESSVLVNGHPEIAQGCHAQGVQLRSCDLTPADARRILPRGWIGCSVHSSEEAARVVDAGADFLLLGPIFPTNSHPGDAGLGTAVLTATIDLGVPVIAIGGMNPERASMVRDAGGYGVACIRALWDSEDPAAAALELLAPWVGEG
jgi:thiamine-phosphate diphosphorylase